MQQVWALTEPTTENCMLTWNKLSMHSNHFIDIHAETVKEITLCTWSLHETADDLYYIDR